MNNRTLTPDEERFLVDLLRNVAFDLMEDDDTAWEFTLDEIEQGLLIFGHDLSV